MQCFLQGQWLNGIPSCGIVYFTSTALYPLGAEARIPVSTTAQVQTHLHQWNNFLERLTSEVAHYVQSCTQNLHHFL